MRLIKFSSLLFTTVFFFSINVSPIFADLANTAWPTSNHDMRRTGRTNAYGPTLPTIKWTKQNIFANLGNGEIRGATIGSDGTLYVAGGTGGVAALDKTTHNKLWQLKIDDSRINNGRAGDNIGDAAEQWINYPPTIATDGTLYVSSEWGWAVAIDPVTGAPKWYVQSGKTETSVAIDSDTMYFYSWNDNFYAYSLGDGFTGTATDPKNQTSSRMKWRWQKMFGTMGFTYGLPAIGSDGRVYFAYEGLFSFYPNRQCQAGATPVYPTPIAHCEAQMIATINLGQTGQGNGWYGPVLDEGRKVAYYTNNKEVYAVDISTIGANRSYSKKWANPFPLGAYARGRVPALGSDGTIYVGSDNGFFAINPDGTRKWKAQIGKTHGNPIIDARGIIYVFATNNNVNYLHAFNPDGTYYNPNNTTPPPYPFQVSTLGFGGFADQTLSMDSDGTIYLPYDANGLVAVGQSGPQPTTGPTNTPTPTLTPTRTPTPSSTPTQTPGDTNNDHLVNIQDYVTVVSHINQLGSIQNGDVTGDGKINLYDYSFVISNFTLY